MRLEYVDRKGRRRQIEGVVKTLKLDNFEKIEVVNGHNGKAVSVAFDNRSVVVGGPDLFVRQTGVDEVTVHLGST